AASGIGRAAAEVCRREGAGLALLDVNPDVERVAGELEALPLIVDLRDLAALPGAVARAAEAMDGLDGVVNCAGANVTRPLAEVTLADWAKAMEINLTAPFVICQAAVPRLSTGAAIVNVVS